MTHRRPAGEEERLVRSAAALWRDLGEEVVLTTSSQDGFELLNPTASAVWRLLERPSTAAGLTETLAEDFQVTADRLADEVEELLRDLVERGLVERLARGDR